MFNRKKTSIEFTTEDEIIVERIRSELSPYFQEAKLQTTDSASAIVWSYLYSNGINITFKITPIIFSVDLRYGYFDLHYQQWELYDIDVTHSNLVGEYLDCIKQFMTTDALLEIGEKGNGSTIYFDIHGQRTKFGTHNRKVRIQKPKKFLLKSISDQAKKIAHRAALRAEKRFSTAVPKAGG